MDNAERRKYYLEKIAQFRLLDDTFMSIVFNDKKCAEFLIQQILDDPTLKVISVSSQKELKNLNGRSIRLDIHAIDSNGKAYDIEVERNDSRATPKRARYNASLMDSYITEPGDDYEKLPESYVIFVTENDVWKGNLPVYTADRCIKELGNVPFGDESHILFVNTAYTGDSRLCDLFHDFRCQNPDKMKNEVLADRVKYFKKSNEGVGDMCQIMEEIFVKGEERGEARGEARGLALGIKQGEERGEARGLALGIKQGEERGIKLGEERGIKLGIKQGEERGKELGTRNGKKQIIMQFLKNMSIREVANNLDMTVEEVEKIIESND